MSVPDHQGLREMLGAYALGHLDHEERQGVRAHLDDCPACRAELAELQPVADLLDTVVPAHVATLIRPPARRPRGGALPRIALVAATLVAVALAGGVVGRTTAPEEPAVPLEAVTLEVAPSSGLAVESAGVVPHTWGVELRIVAQGFADGETFRAAFRERGSGRLTPAGRFIGTGPRPAVCNLQSALLRDDVTEVVVMDASGSIVLSADL